MFKRHLPIPHKYNFERCSNMSVTISSSFIDGSLVNIEVQSRVTEAKVREKLFEKTGINRQEIDLVLI